MQFNAIGAVKFVAASIVGLGTGKIVQNIIKNNVPAPETLIDKVTMVSAAWVIGGIATTATKKYTNDMIDDVIKAGGVVVDSVKKSQKLGRINRNESTFEKEGLDPVDYWKDETGKWKLQSDELKDVASKIAENHKDDEPAAS